MDRQPDIFRFLSAAGGAPSTDGKWTFLCYEEKNKLCMKTWTGTELADKVWIATGVRSGTSAPVVNLNYKRVFVVDENNLLKCFIDPPRHEAEADSEDEGNGDDPFWEEDEELTGMNVRVHEQSQLAVSYDRKTIYIFYQNIKGSLSAIKDSGEGWKVVNLPASNVLDGTPLATCKTNGAVYLFYINIDGTVRYMVNKGGKWKDEFFSKAKIYGATPKLTIAEDRPVFDRPRPLVFCLENNILSTIKWRGDFAETVGELEDGEFQPTSDHKFNKYYYWSPYPYYFIHKRNRKGQGAPMAIKRTSTTVSMEPANAQAIIPPLGLDPKEISLDTSFSPRVFSFLQPVTNMFGNLFGGRGNVDVTQERARESSQFDDANATVALFEERVTEEDIPKANEIKEDNTKTRESKPAKTSVEDTPVEDTPVKDTPVEDTPVEDTPVKDTPVEETLIEETLIEEILVEDTSVEDTPVEETPVEDTPVEDTPVEETLVEEILVERILVEETPVQETDLEETGSEEGESDNILTGEAGSLEPNSEESEEEGTSSEESDSEETVITNVSEIGDTEVKEAEAEAETKEVESEEVELEEPESEIETNKPETDKIEASESKDFRPDTDITAYLDPKVPVVEVPVVEVPVMETTVMETPVMETPVMETPVMETPVLKTPIMETPIMETPNIKSPIVEAPAVKVSDFEVSDFEESDLEESDLETPDLTKIPSLDKGKDTATPDTPDTPKSKFNTPKDVQETMERFVEDNGLSSFYSKDHPYLRNVAKKAFDHQNSEDNLLKTDEDTRGFAIMGLYQPVLYCDDSSSMNVETRATDQRELAKRVARITTRVVPPSYGTSLQFINYERDLDDNLTAKKVKHIMKAVKPRGNTKIGTNLEKKILKPLIYDILKSGKTLERPIIVSCITDGCPGGESSEKFKEMILKCVRFLREQEYPPTAVRFQISQIGNDSRADKFLRELKDDPALKEVLYCTSQRLDEEFKKLRHNEEDLERWLLNTLLTPVLGERISELNVGNT